MANQVQGVPLSGSGHSAEPEPSCTVSAETASVTNPFTPGPWLIVPLESPGPYRVIIGPPIPGAPFSAKLIAHVYSGPTDDRLIAAAPDLYEAVQHAHNEFIRCAKLHRAKRTDEGDANACHNASMAEEMHRALAKARGQQVSA